MKGIILAGENSSKLYPLSEVYSTELFSVYDKPMVYYPLSILMLSGIVDILIVCSDEDLSLFKRILKDGSHLGININYIVNKKPKNQLEAILNDESFFSDPDGFLVIKGDSIFYGDTFVNSHIIKVMNDKKTTLFAHKVGDIKNYDVVEIDRTQKIKSIEESPSKPKSNIVLTGLFYFNINLAENIKKIMSNHLRDLSLIELLKEYLEQDNLNIELLGRGIAWLDAGLHDDLLIASTFIQSVEKRQGLKVACLEEIAFRKKYITKKEFEKLALRSKGSYGEYLREILSESEEYDSL